jgi:hypothetical protein
LKSASIGGKLMAMRSLIFGVMLLAASVFVHAQKTIRQVDFKNFSYPLSSHLLVHASLQWLDTSSGGTIKGQSIRLVNGVTAKDTAASPGFTLQSVAYADVTGDGKEDAVVVVRYDSGSTQNTHYVYIYSLADGHPKLLAYCHTGGGTNLGLQKAYGEQGQLVIEMLDRQNLQGKCCTSGFVRTRYKWHDGGFQISGVPEHETLKQP